jgi:hypothetical protein
MRRVELYAHEANWPGFTPPRWPVFTPPLTKLLILLRHKRNRVAGGRGVDWQHGHRARDFASATVRRFLIAAIEFSTWRSGRMGGASGSITVG